MKHKIICLFALLFFISCTPNGSMKTLVNIPEASWICYFEKNDSFFVASDEGSVYEISKKGKILQKNKLWKYDLEWIMCENNKLYVLEEESGNLLELKPKDLSLIKIIKNNLSKKDRKKYFDADSGAEWLTSDGKNIYISTQHKKNNLLEFTLKDDELILKKVFDIEMDDLSGLTFHKKDLYILSDKHDVIWIYDIKTEKVIKKIPLPKGNWEGIVFDNKGDIYLADDAGRVVKK